MSIAVNAKTVYQWCSVNSALYVQATSANFIGHIHETTTNTRETSRREHVSYIGNGDNKQTSTRTLSQTQTWSDEMYKMKYTDPHGDPWYEDDGQKLENRKKRKIVGCNTL